MNIQDDSGELLYRREFFKKAAKKTLPVVAAIVAPSLFINCSKEDDNDEWIECACSGDCSNTCYSGCYGISSSPTCSDCANNCAEGCGASCSNTCENSSNNTSDTEDDKGDGTEDEDGISKATGEIDGYGYVDLGLSVKWATQNIGASSPERAGTYLRFCVRENNGEGASSSYFLLLAGYEKGDSIAGSSFDHAVDQMGRYWKTPTKAQFEELIDNCDGEEYNLNGVTGLRLKSRKNGKSIFIPAVGRKDGYTLTSESSVCLWSSTVYSLITSTGYGYTCVWTHLTTGGYRAFTRGEREVDGDKMPIRAVTDGTLASTGCNGGCYANCANNSTGSACSGCASTCSSGCKEKCDYNCAATCDNHCYGTCDDSCGGSCRYISAGASCSGCAQTCYNRCYHDCSYACSTNCQSSCVNGSK